MSHCSLIENMGKADSLEVRTQEIQSGHFMVSNLEDSESDFEDKGQDGAAGSVDGENELDNMKDKHKLNFDNLTSLFKYMQIAYTEKITSPKWNQFHGLRFAIKNKIRLNNIIWREYHMQFVKNSKPVVVQFQIPLTENHLIPDAVVMEGKYWKRRLSALCRQYNHWRLYAKNRICGTNHSHLTRCCNELLAESDFCTLDKDNILKNIPSTEFSDYSTCHSKFLEDLMMDIDNNFGYFFQQPIGPSDSSEVVAFESSDIMQPNLYPLHPSHNKFNKTIELDMFHSAIKHNPNLLESKISSSVQSLERVNDSSVNPEEYVYGASDIPVSLDATFCDEKILTPVQEHIPMHQANVYNYLPDAKLVGDQSHICVASHLHYVNSALGNGQSLVQGEPFVAHSHLDNRLSNPGTNYTECRVQKSHVAVGPSSLLESDLRARNRNGRLTEGKSTLLNALLQGSTVSVRENTGFVPYGSLDHPSETMAKASEPLICNAFDPHSSGYTLQLSQSNMNYTAVSASEDAIPTKARFSDGASANPACQQPVHCDSKPSNDFTIKAVPKLFTDQLQPRYATEAETMLKCTEQLLDQVGNENNDLKAPPISPTRQPIANYSFMSPSYYQRTPVSDHDEQFNFQKPTHRTRNSDVVESKNLITNCVSSQHTSQSNAKHLKELNLMNDNFPQGTNEGNLLPRLRSNSVDNLISAHPYRSNATFQSTATSSYGGSVVFSPVPSSLFAGSPCSSAPILDEHSPIGEHSCEDRRRISLQAGLQTLRQLLHMYSGVDGPGSDSNHNRSDPAELSSNIVNNSNNANIKVQQAILSPTIDVYSEEQMIQSTAHEVGGTGRASKATTLCNAAQLIKKLRGKRNSLEIRYKALRDEANYLQSAISTCCGKLSPCGTMDTQSPPPQQQHDHNLRECYHHWFHDYVHKQTELNWKFYLFSLILTHVFKSFCTSTVTSSPDQFIRSVHGWLEAHCSLVQLRPAVTQAMCKLSTTTAVLEDPEKLPEQARMAASTDFYQLKSNPIS